MPRYRSEDNLPYFCTLTVLDWIPVFIEENHIIPLIKNLQFCRKQRGLRLYAYVVMPDHLHLIAGAEEGLHPIIRDFKRFSSRTIHELLTANSRSTTLSWFQHSVESARSVRGEFSMWVHDFQPKAIYSQDDFQERIEHLHQNPVRKGLVTHPGDWRFSSAGYYLGDRKTGEEIDSLEE